MLGINGKQWDEITSDDVKACLDSIEESYFYEFKSEEVSNEKIAKEVSAFANTYGGYIFIGISDDKTIEGCSEWTEERITSILCDSIMPIPSFDVKKIAIDEKNVYIIRVDEGSEPPYITNKGEIYERISSSARKIATSERLTQLFREKESNRIMLEKKITIANPYKEIDNIYGYLDLGFSLALRRPYEFKDRFDRLNIESICEKCFPTRDGIKIYKTKDSIVVSIYSVAYQGRNKVEMPANAVNFIEIMNDGSVRLRCMFVAFEDVGTVVEMNTIIKIVKLFKKVYSELFQILMCDNVIYARKYEQIHVNKQFCPFLLSEDDHDNMYEDEMFEYYSEKVRNKIKEIEEAIVVDDRIPKVGFETVDFSSINENAEPKKDELIIDKLFESEFLKIGTLLKID